MIILLVLFFVGLLGVFIFGTVILYRRSATWRYQMTVRAWLTAFTVEIGYLTCIDEHYVPWLGLTIRNGFTYMMDLTINVEETIVKLLHGQYPDLALVLALPLLPALGGFWYDQRRYRQRPSV